MEFFRSKKEKPPELIINKFNGLFKSNEEVKKALIAGAHELFAKDTQTIRKEQLDLYKNFAKKVLGYDTAEDYTKDPFYTVTQTPIDKVYLDKHDIVNKNYLNNDQILISTVLLLSGNFGYDSNRYDNRIDDETANIRFHFFDPVTINESRDWILQFGFADFEEKKNNFPRFVGEGCIMLEPAVLDAIADATSEQKTQIETKLQEVSAWFNHDLTAHGVYLPKMDSDLQIISSSKNKLAKNFYELTNENLYTSAFVGELWSLNLHVSLFQEFVKERPAIIKMMALHLSSYIRTVESLSIESTDLSFPNDVKEYLMKTYAFCFFRLINPKDFATNPMFKESYDKYPNLADLGNVEDQTREHAFGTPGMYSPKTKTYISHSDVMKQFTDKFEDAEKMNHFLTKIENFLDPQYLKNISFSEHEKNMLTNYLLSRSDFPRFFTVWIPEAQFQMRIGNVTLGDIIFEKKHIKKLVNILLDDKRDINNFFNDAFKACYGFSNDRTRKELTERK